MSAEGISDRELALIFERDKKAHSGTWIAERHPDDCETFSIYLKSQVTGIGLIKIGEVYSEGDAEFIANARADISRLREEVQRLMNENDRLYEKIEKIKSLRW